jgi:hypothetical protein
MPPSVAARLASMPEAIPAQALVDKRTGKPKRISKPVKQLIRLILSGECKTAKAAAERVGLTPDWARASLALPHVQVFISEERRRTIAQASLRAAGRLTELIDADSEHVSLQASQHVLAIEGISPPERGHGVQINMNISPGYIVKLRHAEGAELDGSAVDVTPGPDAQPVAIGTTGRGER